MIALALSLLAAAPDHHEKPEAEPDADGFVSIFDGETLDGWKLAENDSFTVEDGAIKAAGPRGHLFHTQPLTDFVFECEVKTTPGSNAGIFICSEYQESGWPSAGYEVQVNVSHPDPRKTGSLYKTVDILEAPAKDDQWYVQRIEVKGKDVIVSVDGRVLYRFTEPDGVTGPKKLGEGVLALQAHDPKSVVYFRNLRVKDLSGE